MLESAIKKMENNLIAEKPQDSSYLTNIAEVFIKNFDEQMDSLHHQELIFSRINSNHEIQTGISAINQLVVAVL